MNCQKCGKHAVVHLTELVADKTGRKQPVEVHLCMAHASEAGYITQAVGEPPLTLEAVQYEPKKALKPTAIVAKEETPTDLAIMRPGAMVEEPVCIHCNMTWSSFKQNGLLGCARCYDMFDGKLTPLIRRAQENFSQHVGKIPARGVPSDPARQITTARLRRELDQALTAENYEAAAALRDKLRGLGKN